MFYTCQTQPILTRWERPPKVEICDLDLATRYLLNLKHWIWCCTSIFTLYFRLLCFLNIRYGDPSPPYLQRGMMWGHSTAQIHSRPQGRSHVGNGEWSCSIVVKVTEPVRGQAFTAEWCRYGRQTPRLLTPGVRHRRLTRTGWTGFTVPRQICHMQRKRWWIKVITVIIGGRTARDHAHWHMLTGFDYI